MKDNQFYQIFQHFVLNKNQ